MNSNNTESKIGFNSIKNINVFKEIIYNLPKKTFLQLIKYNKRTKYKLDIDISDYKDFSEIFSQIEVEIKCVKGKYGNFINIPKNTAKYYHIYFNNDKQEKKRNYITQNDKITKIKIVLDYQVSFFELFKNCTCIESINFIKFYRANIINMSFLFNGCSSLKELNLSKFKTNEVTKMFCMFAGCSSLEKLNLSNFNFNKIKEMGSMFYGCSSLKEVVFPNFNTKNIVNMSNMFNGCSSLEKLNLPNFNINKVANMDYIFLGCSSLKEIKGPVELQQIFRKKDK